MPFFRRSRRDFVFEAAFESAGVGLAAGLALGVAVTVGLTGGALAAAVFPEAFRSWFFSFFLCLRVAEAEDAVDSVSDGRSSDDGSGWEASSSDEEWYSCAGFAGCFGCLLFLLVCCCQLMRVGPNPGL